jgi:hypothetical protein
MKPGPFTSLCQLAYVLVVCLPVVCVYAVSAVLALPFAGMSRIVTPVINFARIKN